MGKTSDSIGNMFRRIHGSAMRKPANFGWIDSSVAGSGRPTTQTSVNWIKKQGVSRILSLTETPLPKSWLESAGLESKHIPVNNHEVPSVQKVEEAVKFMRDSVKEGKHVLVHCAAGQGRTGTILAAYLVANGMTPEQAIDKVRTLRPDSIEKYQEKAVNDFYEKVVKKEGN